MEPDLSVVLERVDAVEHIRVASAALTNLRVLLHRADRHSQQETSHAGA